MGGEMTQNCPLCGKTVYPERDGDPDNLAGRFYFCYGNYGGCRATFPRTSGFVTSSGGTRLDDNWGD